jgi:hypothetical protein
MNMCKISTVYYGSVYVCSKNSSVMEAEKVELGSRKKTKTSALLQTNECRVKKISTSSEDVFHVKTLSWASFSVLFCASMDIQVVAFDSLNQKCNAKL